MKKIILLLCAFSLLVGCASQQIVTKSSATIACTKESESLEIQTHKEPVIVGNKSFRYLVAVCEDEVDKIPVEKNLPQELSTSYQVPGTVEDNPKPQTSSYGYLEERVEKSGLDTDLNNNLKMDRTYGGWDIEPSSWVETFGAAATLAAALPIGTDVQAYDADLTTYAGITPSANVQTMLGSADNSAIRTNIGVAIGTDVQAYDADLTTYGGITPSSNVQSLLGAADYSEMLSLLGTEPLPAGTIDGQIPIWTTDSWLAASSLTNISISGGTANMMAYWDSDQKLAASTLRPGQITTGATTTPDANTNIGIDTTSDQLKYYGGAVRVLTYKKQKDFVVKSPVDADDFLLFKARQAITITDIHCIVDPADTGESISVDVQECDATGDNCATVDAAITADNDGAEDDGTLSNGAIDANDWVKVVLGAPTGTISFLTCSIFYTITAD